MVTKKASVKSGVTGKKFLDPGAGMSATKASRWPMTSTPDPATPKSTPGTSASTSLASASSTSSGSAVGVAPSQVSVQTVDPAVVNQIGGRFIGFRVARADGGSGSASVSVQVDVSSVVAAFGAGFAERAQLVRFPACVLTTPTVPSCRVSTPVVSVADPVAKTVTAVVTADPAGSVSTTSSASAATSTSSLVVSSAEQALEDRDTPRGSRSSARQPVAVGALRAASTDPGSVFALSSSGVGGGTFSATQLKASDAWVVGEQSGSFDYSYPLPAAPATGGTSPSLSLSYDSGSVDGLTDHENNQSSPVGLGWTMSVPFIEQRLKPCKDDLAGNTCWAGGNSMLSMNGHTTGLNYLATNSAGDRDTFRMQDDPGWRVERVFAGSANPNGDASGVYWKVTTTDGTQYYFGRENSDWSSSPTNSTLTEPVYAQSDQDVCWGNDDHRCQMGYRWNLAYVVDPVGNLQVYQWEKGRYSYATDGWTPQRYDGAGYLTTIKYGKNINVAGFKDAYSPQKIDFTYGWRCDYADCRAPVPHDGSAADYPDAPLDQWCDADAPDCHDSAHSPMFFYLKKLNSVTSTYYAGSGTYTPVDRVDLDVQWPKYHDQDGTAVMWLNTITRTGYSSSGATASVPAVTFGGAWDEWPANRWDESQAHTYQNKPRINDVWNELGGHAHVTYGQPNACDSQTLDNNEDYQTTDCFPSKEGDGHQAWFRRYLVTKLEVIDKYGAPTQTTTYDYDTDGGAAWHSDNDLVTPWDEQSWSDYRGYAGVTVTQGTPGGTVSTVKKLFFRGMDGDHTKDGSKSVTIYTPDLSTSPIKVDDGAKDTLGHAYTDSYYLRGKPLEERTQRMDKSELDATQHEYAANVLEDGPEGPFGLHQNGVVQVNEVLTRSMVTSGGVARKLRHTLHRTFDPVYGLMVSSQDDGDPVSGSAATCSYTTYVRNTDLYIVDREATAVVAAGVCPADGSAPAADKLLNRNDTYYDGNFTDLGGTPTNGLVTKSVGWASAQGTADPSTAITGTRYDVYGRTVGAISPRNFIAAATSFDTAGPASSTSITAPNGPVTGMSVTNEKGFVSSQVLDPGRGQPTSTADVNGRVTTLTYDPLGRLTNVRLPGDTFDAKTFSYTVSNSAPSVVTTSAYPAAGAAPIKSWSFLDSLGRTFQSQTASPTGSVITTGTRFDERGNTAANVAAFSGTGAPGTVYGQWYDPAFTGTLPSQTVLGYDDDNKPVTSSLVAAGTTKWTTTTSYDGTASTITPPANTGSGQANVDPVTQVSDLDGHLLFKTQSGNTTRYTYDLSNHLTKITSPSGKETSYGYDWLDRRTSTTDLDAGASTTDYYPSGVVKHSHDAKGNDLFTDLDVLGRPTATYAGTNASGAKLSSTTYDGAPLGAASPNDVLKGTVTSSTAYVGSTPSSVGTAYTTAFGYDTQYRPVRTDQIIPTSANAGITSALANTYTTTATFDGLGRQTSVTYPAAGGLAPETVTTSFNGAYATKLTGPSLTYVADTTYTPIGQVATQTLGASGALGSLQRSNSWDPATGKLLGEGAISTISATGTTGQVQNDAYTYSPTGDITKNTDQVKNQQQCFTYDGQDRLVAALTSTNAGAAGTQAGSSCAADQTGPAPYSETYAYDADANLVGLTHNGTRKTFGYGADSARSLTGGPHAPTSVTTTPTTGAASTATYSYDQDGQLATKVDAGTTTTEAWDVQNHLVSTTIGTAKTSYTYGPDGTRWVRTSPTETVLYLAGQELHLAAGQTTPTVIRSYAFSGGTVAIRKTGTGGGLFWMLADQQGSASIAVNAADGTYTRDRYLPYGGSRATTDTGTSLFTLPGDRGWLGQVQDKDTGLNYLQARYYDPALAHFISTDPLNVTSNPATANPYSYAADNPITFTDPTGQEAQSWCYTPSCKAAAEKAEKARQWQLYQQTLAKIRAAQAAAAAREKAQIEAREAARDKRVAAQAAIAKNPAALRADHERTNAAQAELGKQRAKWVAQRTHDLAVKDPVLTTFTAVSGLDDANACAHGSASSCAWAAAAIVPIPEVRGLEAGVVAVRAARGAEVVEKLSGSGAVKGILEVSDRVKSVAAVKNFSPAEARDFVFDPVLKRFATGANQGISGHDALRLAIGADESTVIGGRLLGRGPNGEFLTNQWSGHYGNRWTEDIRTQFVEFMSGFGLDVKHSPTY